jgi:hypothetical protein
LTSGMRPENFPHVDGLKGVEDHRGGEEKKITRRIANTCGAIRKSPRRE